MRITKAAITPGTHPQIHKIKTIRTEPQPLSKTDSGGKIIANNTRQKPIKKDLIDLILHKSLNSSKSYKLHNLHPFIVEGFNVILRFKN